MRTPTITLLAALLSLVGLSSGSALAQDELNLVVPQRGVVITNGVEMSYVDANIDIRDQAATTSLTITLRNTTPRPQEAQLLLPVPNGASVSRFRLEGLPDEGVAKMLPIDEARRIYEDIVRRTRDPGLVEFVGMGLIRTSVFPVPAGGSQVLELTYESVIPADAGRVDYILPRSSSLEATGVEWGIRATLRHRSGLGAIYSPSHELGIERAGDDLATVKVLTPESPGAFRMSFLIAPDDEPAASIIAYPDADGVGGYFMLLAGVPDHANDRPAIKREVTLVLDRSGSMRGEKLEQAKAAALQIIEAMNEGELFNIIDYSDSIESFAERPIEQNSKSVAAARVYLESIKAVGGTNIHDAMLEALRPRPAEGVLPMVLFLTDGLPTVGERRESAIRDAVKDANVHERRIFSFGVGHDVNTPLLSAMSLTSRGAPTFVAPGEDVEVKVGQVFRRLAGPVLASPELAAAGPDGEPAPGVLRDVLPATLPDVFEGDQLIAVGRYENDTNLTFKLSGNYMGKTRVFNFAFDAGSASAKHAYVPRLWAGRKIGVLLEEIRQAGADGVSHSDHLQELTDEVVRLSQEWGILTEYTAWLAAEPTDLARRPQPEREERLRAMSRRVQEDRSGESAVMRDSFNAARQSAGRVDAAGANVYALSAGAELGVVAEGEAKTLALNVQQVADRTLYNTRGRWIEATLLDRDESEPPDQTIDFGSDAYFALASRLANEGRQAILAVRGDVELLIDGQRTLVRGPRS